MSSSIFLTAFTNFPGLLPFRHLTNDLHRFHADGADAHQQVNHLLLVICKAIGVELLPDGGILGRFLLVAFQNPFQGGVGAQAVLPGFRRDTAQGGKGINFN